LAVTPANAGVQNILNLLDSGVRRNDRKRHFPTFYEFITFNAIPICRYYAGKNDRYQPLPRF
jgi:hypothetical protein